MTMAAIFAKFDDLERKIALVTSNPSVVQSVTTASNSVDIENVLNRLSALEASVANIQQPDINAVYNRIAELENRLLPADLPLKVATLEEALASVSNITSGQSTEIQALNDKLTHLETVTLPHMLLRIENLEQKMAASSSE